MATCVDTIVAPDQYILFNLILDEITPYLYTYCLLEEKSIVKFTQSMKSNFPFALINLYLSFPCQITTAEGERIAKEYHMTFVESSARTGMNVELAFNAIAKELHKKSLTAADCFGEGKGAYCKTRDSFNINEYVESEKEKVSCC